MKNIQNHKIVIILFAFFSVLLTSCSKDDDGMQDLPSDITEKLQGTWTFQNGTTTIMGYTTNMTREQVEQMGKDLNMSFWDLNLTFSSNRVNGSRYRIEGNKLIIEDANPTNGVEIIIKSITETTLVLHESFNLEGMELTCDLTYKKR